MHCFPARVKTRKRKKYPLPISQNELIALFVKKLLGKRKESFWHPGNVLGLMKRITFPVINHLFQFRALFCPCFCVHQQCGYTMNYKWVLLKYQASKTSTYQNDSLKKKKKNRNFFVRNDSLADKNLSSPVIELSIMPSIFLDTAETGFHCQIFLNNCVRRPQKL